MGEKQIKNKTFDQKKYEQDYKKEHYKQVKFVMKKEEFPNFIKKLDKNNIKITEFFKKCIENLDEIMKIIK